MNWKGISNNCLSSVEGYLVSRYRMQNGNAFIARTPTPASKILYSGESEKSAKAACINHFESTQGKAA
ncbi:hypothetical protein NTD84_03230 [Pseudomonas sp. 14P_8.1_Bac3]|uniref:hypothetical protein n=1 Tax=Pseudomonas sp. 14P_8.1_Bac3 TaxID=2971621 RepID=UPI0021CA64D5|nr:hypothetical protein [Pseudomonas sp. 14P_8.1_Bac3]MCU1758733.1 hypothetical protein [Pseudomonas sp. 14P_8.1_Bac3]